MGALESVELSERVELTTTRAESSYGIPVLVVEDVAGTRTAYGRADTTPRGDAAVIVGRWIEEPGRTREEQDFARKFLGRA